MNKHFVTRLSVLVLIVLVVLLIWQHEKRPKTLDSGRVIGQSSTSSVDMLGRNANQNVPASTLNTSSSVSPKSITINDHDRLPEIFQKYNQSHNIPIAFYGQVIDQESNPVPNVKITISIQQTYMTSPTTLEFKSKYVEKEVKTDANGFFSINGENGDSLNLKSIQKDGYQLSAQTLLTYGYENVAVVFHPDSQNPVIFQMWKLGESQKLISHSLSRIGIPVDGQPIQFDLLNGTKASSGGQLIVRFERNPQILMGGDSGYDWRATFEIPNGGFVANSDEFMYQAPENGYQETYTVEMPKGATNWATTLDQQFYIRLGNGNYGNLTVHLPTFHNTPPIGLDLGITINPNGSRNLQP